MNNDLISREALKKAIKTECNPYGKPTIDFESGKRVLKLIDNAQPASDRYDEGFRDGYAQCINDKEERKENSRLFQKGGKE